MITLLDSTSGCTPKQIDKINNIVIVQHQRFQRASTQKYKPNYTFTPICKVFSKRVKTSKDKTIQNKINLTFTLDCEGMKAGTAYELITLDKNNKYEYNVIAQGVNSLETPIDFISNYGVFFIKDQALCFFCQLEPQYDVYFVNCRGRIC